MKFGGTSVGSGMRILHVAKIIRKYAKRESIVVVVSAMCGVTDKLISIFDKYKSNNIVEAKEELLQLYQLHMKAFDEIDLKKKICLSERKNLNRLFGELMVDLTVKRNYKSWDKDYVISFGERFAVQLLSCALCKLNVTSQFIDSSRLIVTNNAFGNSKVLMKETRVKIEEVLFPMIMDGIVPVVTGFYGSAKDGRIATLGRGGSDYSATILAHALDAQEVILWKEVDGVYSHDPKKNGNGAKFFPQLTYAEAIKMAKNGAKIIHPHALDSIASKDIVVWVKNTFKPDFAGTKIWKGFA